MEEGYHLPKFDSNEWDYHDWDNPYARSEEFYVSNGALKGAMLLNGYFPQNIKDVNWIFNVSRTSPACEDPYLRDMGRMDQYKKLVNKVKDVERKVHIITLKEQQENNKN